MERREAESGSPVTAGVPHVVSLNVGRVKLLAVGRDAVPTGFFKLPVTTPVRAERLGFAGDEQADLTVHGGAGKAIYAYAGEDLAWWSQVLGRPIEPGLFGENLTTANLDLGAARIGDRWSVGTAVLIVTQPRVPCYKFAARMDDPHFPRRFAKALRTGLYLAVSTPGDIACGDTIEVTSDPQGPTIRSVARRILNMAEEEAE